MGPRAQRTALLREAARRLFEGDPVMGKAPLPTAAEMKARTPGEPEGEPAANGTTPDGEGESATGSTARRSRGTATGDPRADRSARASQDETDALVLSQLRSYPPGEDIALERITAGIKEVLPLVKLRPSLKRLVKGQLVIQHGDAYQAAMIRAHGEDEGGEDGGDEGGTDE